MINVAMKAARSDPAKSHDFLPSVFSILNRPCTLEDAIRETENLLTETAEQAVRLMLATRSVLRP